MGSCYWSQTQHTDLYQLQSLPISTQKEGGTKEIHRRQSLTTSNLPIQLPLRQQILSYKKERQQVQTSLKLPKPQQVDYPKQIPPPTRLWTHPRSSWETTLLKVQYSIGLQQCTHQGRWQVKYCKCKDRGEQTRMRVNVLLEDNLSLGAILHESYLFTC